MENIKDLSMQQLQQLCVDVRKQIIDKVNTYGGHLSSNLGVVEITVALHFVFDCFKDKLIFDVGHQCYTHKILTGRNLDNLRTNSGVTGFPNPQECDADLFSVGHGTTSLSQALGLARARDFKDEQHNVVAIIGDGAFGGGMAYEALNDIGVSKKKLLIILNDNKMSISQNVGAMSNHFAKLRVSKSFARFKNNVKRCILVLPILGKPLIKFAKKVQKKFSRKVIETFGIPYYGPFDGHDLPNLINLFKELSNEQGPVFVHLMTEKGKGFKSAEVQPELFHGLQPKSTQKIMDYETENKNIQKLQDTVKNKQNKSFSNTMCDALIELASEDKRIVAITAGMSGGTGLTKFSEQFADRFFDVGMAEQHATTMAAGLAKGGCKPFFAVYSTFLQRAYDQVIHDVCINNLPVTFLIDRAGIAGSDGVTHQGIYDIGYLSQIPNMTILCPKDGCELYAMMSFAALYNSPLSIRYPKSFDTVYNTQHPINFDWEYMRQQNYNTVLVAAGNRTLDIAMQCCRADCVHANTLKPLDSKTLQSLASQYKQIITLEDGLVNGGFGQQVVHFLQTHGSVVKVVTLGHGDSHIVDLEQKSVFATSGMNRETLQKLIDKFDNI
ncbi:MAG: 1-deoxy-D-xylulose-5-phosphate synthase [Clostridiales bacterium]|jgi:1-deoxy-D-xylulose-5-phosphate synthase|nr:1-deoxy-D-xylulose-5-phosphate synthase [Clostridiales bacterium]